METRSNTYTMKKINLTKFIFQTCYFQFSYRRNYSLGRFSIATPSVYRFCYFHLKPILGAKEKKNEKKTKQKSKVIERKRGKEEITMYLHRHFGKPIKF